MNILFICDVSGDYGGNFLKSILYLSDKLKQEGKNVCFAFPNETKSDKWINELKKYPIYFYSRDYKLSEIKSIVTDAKKKYNINIIHCHFVELKGSIVISLSVLMKKIKVVYHWHCQLYESSNFIKRFVKYLLLVLIYNLRKDAQIGVSAGVSNKLSKYFKRNNVYTVVNAIDIDRLSVIDEENNEIKSNNNHNSVNIMIMGGYRPQNKGLNLLINSMQYLKNNNNSFYNKIKVYIPTTKIEMVSNYIDNYIKSNNLDNSINGLFVFIKPIENIATYYNKIDIFVSPSYSEAFSYSIMEASYCGCQVIATSVPGQSDNTIPGIFWVSDPNKKNDNLIGEELAVNIIKAYKEKCDSRKYIEKLLCDRKYIENNSSMSKWADNIEKIYNKLLK